MRVDQTGRVFFVNHNTKQTTWVDPRTQQPTPGPPAMPMQPQQMPPPQPVMTPPPQAMPQFVPVVVCS